MEPGVKSSEFKMTVVIMAIGVALDVTGIILGTAQEAGAQWGWLAPALTVLGSLMVLVKGLGYTRSRTLLKAADMQAPVAQEVRHIAPLVAEMRELVREAKAARLAPPPVAPVLTVPSASTSVTPPPVQP